jgi:hypothetical protein
VWSVDIAKPKIKNMTEVQVAAKTGKIAALKTEIPAQETVEKKSELPATKSVAPDRGDAYALVPSNTVDSALRPQSAQRAEQALAAAVERREGNGFGKKLLQPWFEPGLPSETGPNGCKAVSVDAVVGQKQRVRPLLNGGAGRVRDGNSG